LYILPDERFHSENPYLVKDHNWPKFTRERSGERYFRRVIQSFAVSLFREDRPWHLVSSRFGYGLVVRTDVREVELLLKGYLVYQTCEAADCYKLNGGQSLVQPVSSSDEFAVMVGPLSLVNHSCEAPYGFTFPSDFLDPATFLVVTDFSAVRKRDLIQSRPSIGHLVYNEEYSRPSRGEEIFVNYGDSLGFTCLCTGCQQSTAKIDGQIEGWSPRGVIFLVVALLMRISRILQILSLWLSMELDLLVYSKCYV
jgi:hypothetical protein